VPVWRRTYVLVSAVIAVVVTLVVVAIALAHRGGSNAAVATSYPISYTILYRVTQNGVPHWEVLSVQRPFVASDLTYTGAVAPGNGDSANAGNMSTPTGLYVVDAQGARLVSGRQPGPPSGDQFVGAALSELTSRGLAEDLGTTSTIAGRSCTLYRFAVPPSGAVAPYDHAADHDDLCFDADGLELSESWTYHGAIVLQRTAVTVRTDAHAAADASLPTPPSIAGAVIAGKGGATITPDSHPSTFIAPPPTPNGFAPSGTAVDFALRDPQDPTQTVATSVVWAFTRGPRVITVEAGSERSGGLPWNAGDTVAHNTRLAGLGPASTVVRSDGFEVRVDLGGGAWVRVRGTVALDELIAYAQRLSHA
jgi:hypothetical protein